MELKHSSVQELYHSLFKGFKRWPITSNFCCDEIEPRKLHTPPTSMVPWLWFNLAETTLARPPQRGGQPQQDPSLVKAPAVGAECKENPAQGKWQETQQARNWDSEKRTQQKAHRAQSQIPEDLQLM